jgi:dsDNA-specific endonuclease/ATPase MutS2
MKDLEKQVKDIAEKVHYLQRAYNERLAGFEQCKRENELLKEKNSKLNYELDQLKKKNTILRIAKNVDQEDDTSNAKKMINEMVREIDKCIGLVKTQL